MIIFYSALQRYIEWLDAIYDFVSVDVDNNINRLIRIHDMTDAASGCNPGLIPRLLGYVFSISIIWRGN